MKRISSLVLLLFAISVLTGCSLESQPAAERKDTKLIALDKLETKNPTESTQVKKQETTSPPQQPPVNPTPPPMTKQQYSTPPTLTIDATKKYTATLKTSAGDIIIALDPVKAPQTVNNFVFLAREKFYDNTIFHRTIAGFMIQGGDPEGTGRGGPGYRFNDEPIVGEYTRGTVAMANAGPNTNGSQFFILHADYPLPKNYVIFGQVASGLDVVDKIATAPTRPEGEGSSPVTPVTVNAVEIIEE